MRLIQLLANKEVKMKNTMKHVEGFTLIEVLVALLILSIGLLGIAGLQTRGQLNNYAAHVRTQASVLAYEIMDKIRINQNFAVTNAVAGGGANGSGYVVNGRPTDTDPNCDESANVCNEGQLRTYDLIEWYDHIAAALPNGDATITWNADGDATTNDYTITISWTLKDDELSTNATSHLTWELRL